MSEEKHPGIEKAFASFPPHLNWMVGKGKLRPEEPLYAVQILDGTTIIAESEHDDLATAIRLAVEAIHG